MKAPLVASFLRAHAKPGQQVGVYPHVVPGVSRNRLPSLCVEAGYSRGAEIGVWRGAYSALFCQASPKMHMLCVDPWISHAEWNDPKNAGPLPKAESLIAGAYHDAKALLGPLNATIVRDFSAEAAKEVPDGSLDFVFVDGNHVFDAVTKDLTLWAPKVRRGGFVSGHDFKIFPNKPMIQVVDAVTAYTKEHAIGEWFVLAGDRTPSYLWVVR